MKDNMPFQAQITEIANGFLVALPPNEQSIIAASRQGQQPPGRVLFCENFEAVVATLKGAWPTELNR